MKYLKFYIVSLLHAPDLILLHQRNGAKLISGLLGMKNPASHPEDNIVRGRKTSSEAGSVSKKNIPISSVESGAD